MVAGKEGAVLMEKDAAAAAEGVAGDGLGAAHDVQGAFLTVLPVNRPWGAERVRLAPPVRVELVTTRSPERPPGCHKLRGPCVKVQPSTVMVSWSA